MSPLGPKPQSFLGSAL
uniref:Uncharacterized protein n=1 Tax=Anguilla anguilla TaxID=7936 RepID=A0A0E9V6V2_ANGAN